ncbi:MAG: anhydro-N-acetylmuramic acid kinase [Alphaproteobacteria bacterium]|nr:anhydro-N-acetylmuramic acid kinase [Alphaproteobacteria bacterium]
MSPPAPRPLRAIGLMSGTSLDGIDIAVIESDGVAIAAFGPAFTLPYDDAMRLRLRAVLAGTAPVLQVEHELTLLHAQAVRTLLERAGLEASQVDVIGFHGQTVLHRPDIGLTWQIGNGHLLARETGIDVACDFRAADVAAGGEGAPLVPVFHGALAARLGRSRSGPLAVLNLGGVGNVTWIGRPQPSHGPDHGDDALIAFDTGPGNALIDDWVARRGGRPFDRDGALALAGTVNAEVLRGLADNAYFSRPPPKSLDRNDFRLGPEGEGLSVEDGAATLAAFTALAAARALDHMPEPPERWLVCGGGRRNPAIMGELRARLGVPVDPVEAVGWNGDALEAQAFAYLAIRSLRGLPLTYPRTTGAPAPLPGGVFFAAGKIPQRKRDRSGCVC